MTSSKSLAVIAVTLLFSLTGQFAMAGGDGCGGICPESDFAPGAIFGVCEITDLKAENPLQVGAHESFRILANIVKKFQVGSKIYLQGGSYKKQPMSLYAAGFNNTANAVGGHLEFSNYSSQNPQVNIISDIEMKSGRLFMRTNWGSGAADYPLVDLVYFDIEVTQNKGKFSLVMLPKQDILVSSKDELVAITGSMECGQP